MEERLLALKSEKRENPETGGDGQEVRKRSHATNGSCTNEIRRPSSQIVGKVGWGRIFAAVPERSSCPSRMSLRGLGGYVRKEEGGLSIISSVTGKYPRRAGKGKGTT